MALIIFGKDEAEWIALRKQLVREGNSLFNNPLFSEVQKLLSNLHNIETSSISMLMNEVFIPLLSHYLSYSTSEYKSEDAETLDSFLMESVITISTLEKTKPTRKAQEYLQLILSHRLRYYRIQAQNQKVVMAEDIVIPLTNDLYPLVEVKKEEPKEEYWVSDEQESGEQAKKVKDKKQYNPILPSLVYRFLQQFQPALSHPNHVFSSYISILKQFQASGLIFKYHLIQIYKNLRSTIMEKFKNVNEENLKQETLSDLILKDSILYGLSQKDGKRFLYELTFILAIKLLNSINVLYRLKGCHYLSQFCEQIYYNHLESEAVNSFARRIANQKIIQKVFTLDANEQILTKVEKLFQFMVRTGFLSNQNLKQILHLAFKGNQNQRKIVLDMVAKIIMRFSLEQVKTMNSMILSVARSDLTPEMVKLIFNTGRFVPGDGNFQTTQEYFWNIISDSDKFHELKLESKSPIIDNFVLLIEKGIQIGKMTMEGAIDKLVFSDFNYMKFQILIKFIRMLPDTKLNEKFQKLKVLKIDGLKYLVEKIQYQNTLLQLISSSATSVTDECISFLITMIQGYRPFSQEYLGVQILTNLTNRPPMFESLLPFYKPQLEHLFTLLISGQVQNILQFSCVKILFTTIHKLQQYKNQNPHMLNGFDEILKIISNSSHTSVKQEAAIFCVELIYNYYSGLNPVDRNELQSLLVDNALKNLKESKQDKTTIGWLIYIEELLNETEIQGVGILKSHGNLVPTKYVNLIVTNETFSYSHGSRDACIRINSNSSLFQLLEKIAYEFKTNPEELKLLIDYNQIKSRYNGKTIEQLHLVSSPLIARSQVETKIQKSPLLTTNQQQIRVLTLEAVQVFSEIFYRFASKGYMGVPELCILMKAATDDEYQYDVDQLLKDFDVDKDGKLSYQQFMDWMVDNSKYRENQVRKMLENLRYRPDLLKYGNNKMDQSKMARMMRYYLFKNEEIYPILFGLIDSPNKQLSDLSKKLLIRLPTYKTSVKWLNNIRTDNGFVLWYQLLLIEYLLEREGEQLYSLICESVKVEQWTHKFLSGEYKKLLQLIEELLKGQIKDQDYQSVYLALKIISKLSLIPSLTRLDQKTHIDKSKMLSLDVGKIETIFQLISRLAFTPQYLQEFLGLLLHHPKLLDLKQYTFHSNVELRRLVSNYIYLHRKLYGRNDKLLEKQINPEYCSEYYEVAVKQIEDDATTYEGIYPLLEDMVQKSTEQHLTGAVLRLFERLLLMFPELFKSHLNIQSLLLEKFKTLPNSSMVPIYNILPKTDLNTLIPCLLSYLEPISPTDRIPVVNNNSLHFVGLKNLGCICYMNAMLQQLFMTKEFRSELMKHKALKEGGIVQQLQKMFKYMESSNRLDYNPREFCYSFDKDIKLHVQEDTEEFVNKLFDRLETDCPDLVEPLEKQFVGKYISVRNCPCGAIATRQQKFFHLTLEVRDCHTLNQSLNKFIEPEVIPDVYCESCKTKKEVSRSTYLSEFPQTLIIHLQRMTFNLETLVRIKLHNYLQFPNEIELKPFTYNSTKDCRYRLKGVIIHTGNPDAGHYYSLIKLGERWYKFDDSNISEFGSDFNKQCYGGEYDYGDFDIKSSKNAYILVYEKKKQTQQDEKVVEEEEDGLFKEQIEKDNIVLERELRFYHKQFTSFIQSIVTQPIVPQSLIKSQPASILSGSATLFENVLNLVRRYLQLSTEISELTYSKLSKVISVLLLYTTQDYSVAWLAEIVKNKQAFYKKLTESPSEWLRKIHKVIMLRLCVRVSQKDLKLVEEILTYLFKEKPFEKIEVAKASELFELCLGLVMCPHKDQKDRDTSIAQMMIKMVLDKIVTFVYQKLDKQDKYKVSKLKIILLDIIILSLLQAANSKQKLHQSSQILSSPKFYQKVLQEEPTIIQRLSLVACQYSYQNQILSEKLLCTFLSFSPSVYSYAIPNFMSIKDSLHSRRIQMLFGIPQRVSHFHPYNFSVKPQSNINSNVITYAAFSSSYKTLSQSICQTASYPNKETTTCIQIMLNLMLYDNDVLTYVLGLSPPSYKFSSMMDLVYEYLKKMKEINDRRYQVLRNLYYRVDELRQQLTSHLLEGQEDSVVLESVFPFVILGRTVKVCSQQVWRSDEAEGKITIEKVTVYTYALRNEPTVEGNLRFSAEGKLKSHLAEFFIESEDQMNSFQSRIEGNPQYQQNQYGPEASLVVIKSTSDCAFKLRIESQFNSMKFLITNSESYINVPWSLSGELSVGVQVNNQTKSHSITVASAHSKSKKTIDNLQKGRNDSSLYPHQKDAERSSQKPQDAHQSHQKDAKQYTSTVESDQAPEMIEGILCQVCTFMNPLSAMEKCQMCENPLY